IETRHAHELRHTIDFRRTGTAFARLTVPATSEIVRLSGLNLMNGVEHNHTLGNFSRVIDESSTLRVAPPNSENCLFHFISSTTCFSCSGISGIGSRRTCIDPSEGWQTTMLTLPEGAPLIGKSARKGPP